MKYLIVALWFVLPIAISKLDAERTQPVCSFDPPATLDEDDKKAIFKKFGQRDSLEFTYVYAEHWPKGWEGSKRVVMRDLSTGEQWRYALQLDGSILGVEKGIHKQKVIFHPCLRVRSFPFTPPQQ